MAAARGVPVRVLGLTFLLVVGATAAEATQAVGALLLLGLLAAPAGAALRLTDRPFPGMLLSAGLSMGALVFGLLLSYLVPQVPPSFAIVAVATLCYAGSVLGTRRGAVVREPPSGPRSPAVPAVGGSRT